jgi:hypothetical protein
MSTGGLLFFFCEIVHLALNNNQSLYETLRQNIKRMFIFE